MLVGLLPLVPAADCTLLPTPAHKPPSSKPCTLVV